MIEEKTYAQRAKSLRDSIAMQEIENNPLTPEEIAMFEMFDRESWSDEQCRIYVLKRLGLPAER